MFQELLKDPANLDLMLRYARLSVAEEDYEAAIGTLERLVDSDPAAQEARFELALAYFALGATEVARYHLEIYRTRGDLTQAEVEAVDRFLAQATNRERSLSFSGFVEGGIVIEEGEEDVGLSYGLGLNANLSLPGRSAVDWQTSILLRGFTFPERSEDNQSIFLLRTGPLIPLGGTGQGPKLKPFLEVQRTVDDDDFDQGTSLSIGAEYRQPLDNGLTLDALAQYGTTDRSDETPDSSFVAGRIGGSFRISPKSSIGLSIRYLNEDFDTGGEDRERVGVRLAAGHAFDGELLGLENWSIRGFARYDQETYEFDREDELFGLGASVKTYFRPDSFVRASVSMFDRSSNLSALDDQDVRFAVEFGMEF